MENVIAIKQTSATITISGILAYLWIDERVLALYWILLIMDFVTGTIKAWLNKDLSSRKAIHWFFSKFTIILLILSVGIFWKILNYDMTFILSSTFSALSLAEMYSIVWNTYEIRTWKKIKEYDAVAILLSKVLWGIKNKLDNIEPSNLDPNKKKNDNKK